MRSVIKFVIFPAKLSMRESSGPERSQTKPAVWLFLLWALPGLSVVLPQLSAPTSPPQLSWSVIRIFYLSDQHSHALLTGHLRVVDLKKIHMTKAIQLIQDKINTHTQCRSYQYNQIDSSAQCHFSSYQLTFPELWWAGDVTDEDSILPLGSPLSS